MAPFGKGLIAIGLMLAAIGSMLWGLGYVPLFGHLPGDFQIRRGSFSIYFPLASCVLLSLALSLIFAIFRR
ncbi:MAG: DUF2905 domain-containing protein [Candidatus Binataceae bacterium]